jgi:hypothetical protein
MKEWAYAGFTFEFIIAFISNATVDGLNAVTFLPLFVLCVLLVSYVFYHKIKSGISVRPFQSSIG